MLLTVSCRVEMERLEGMGKRTFTQHYPSEGDPFSSAVCEDAGLEFGWEGGEGVEDDVGYGVGWRVSAHLALFRAARALRDVYTSTPRCLHEVRSLREVQHAGA